MRTRTAYLAILIVLGVLTGVGYVSLSGDQSTTDQRVLCVESVLAGTTPPDAECARSISKAVAARRLALCGAIRGIQKRAYDQVLLSQRQFAGPKLKVIARSFGITVQQLQVLQAQQLSSTRPQSCETILGVKP